MGSVIGIDIGTSAVKALLVAEDQRILAEAERPLETSRPRPGWSEQDPDDWWRVVEAILDGFARDHAETMAGVVAVGLSGQMHGAVLLGDDDRPLRPAILWNDSRSAGEASRLALEHPALAREVGVVPMPGFTAPKLPWLQVHEPDVVARLRCILLPKDYVRLRLTGERVTDMSDAAGTWWLDEAGRRWSAAAAAATGVPLSVLPRLCEGNAVSGRVRREWTERWGLRPDVIVAGGGGDAATGAVGIGAVREGDAFVSLGTSAQLFVSTDAYRPAPETLVHAFAHALPGRWYQMGAMLNGASTLAYAAALLGGEIAELVAGAEAGGLSPPGLLVLPYLTGERTPHNDPHARGVIFGLSASTTRPQVIQAVLEAVAFSIVDARDALAASGTRLQQAGFIGGGARSLHWTRILASALGVPLVRYRGGVTGPAFGAARLALMAAGQPEETACAIPETLDVTPPEPAWADGLAQRHEKFKRLYKTLKPEFVPA